LAKQQDVGSQVLCCDAYPLKMWASFFAFEAQLCVMNCVFTTDDDLIVA
jgi:hypothetical protein